MGRAIGLTQIESEPAVTGDPLVEQCVSQFNFAMSYFPDVDLATAYSHIATSACIPLA